jgi:hypothetical protein
VAFSKAIAGRRVDLERLGWIEGLNNRIAKQLGLDRPPKPEPFTPWKMHFKNLA